MRSNEVQSARPLMRLVMLPSVAALISASMLCGFISRKQAIAQADRRIAGQVVSFDPVRSTTRTIAGQAAEVGSTKADPLDAYKTGLALLKRNYYGVPIDMRKSRVLTNEAIRGLLFSLQDPFSSFLDPDEWVQFQATTTRGDFEGIGAMLMEDRPNVKVEEPIETGPAERLGIKAGDIISRVDDAPVLGKSLDEVVKMIKGPAGSKVKITVVRNRQSINYTITRARVEPPIVKFWMEDSKSKIGHILLQEFNEKSLDQLNHAFASLQNQGMRALVFDLRYNPGGLLDVAVQLASVFISRNSQPALKNTAVIIHEGSGREQGRPLETVETSYRHVPLVVLVNDNSASASEIVSGAIKDYSAGTLIGQRTYGKGCVQTLFPLDDGSCLRLTTALYFPPRHYDINYKQDEDHYRIPGTGGLIPDVAITQSPKWKMEDWKDKTNDTQLQAALEFLRSRLEDVTVPNAIQKVQGEFKTPNERVAAQAPRPSKPPIP